VTSIADVTLPSVTFMADVTLGSVTYYRSRDAAHHGYGVKL
jgi:hypothetical protein